MGNKLIFNPVSGQFDFVNDAQDQPDFKLDFVIADWTGPVGGEYSITIPALNHGKGIYATCQIYKIVSPGVFETVLVNRVLTNSSGDISIYVLETPDLRFDGRITIS